MEIPSVKLNSGYSIPVFGLGTWKSKPGEVRTAVENAISAGYRHIDCAPLYENECEVGEAIATKIKDGTVTRDKLFVTSKLWNTYHEPEQVEIACKQSLHDLGLDYLDLYLIHLPMGFKQKQGMQHETDANGKVVYTDRDYLDTWNAMEKLVSKGLVRSIGVSNFTTQMLTRVCERGSIKPAVNQIECHPYLIQKNLSSACKTKDVVVTAYSPLSSPDRPWAKPGDPKLLEEPKILELAKKYGKTPAQIILRYQIERGHVTIPKTVSPSRLLENKSIFDFSLSEADVASIESLDCGGRILVIQEFSDHKFYPFAIYE